jgi:hypothetical protein
LFRVALVSANLQNGFVEMMTFINPPLEGLTAERFLALAQQLARRQDRRFLSEISELLETEVRWARTHPQVTSVLSVELRGHFGMMV